MTAAQLEEKLRKISKKVCGKQSRKMLDGLAAAFPIPQYDEITCWYKEDDLCDSIEEFCRHDPERLKLVINFAPVAVK